MPDTTPITGENFIGTSTSRDGKSHFQVADRLTGSLLPGQFAWATFEEVDRAGQLAGMAFDDWKTHSSSSRAKFLRAIADGIESLGDELLERAAAETALPIARLTGERARTTSQLRMFSDVVEEGSWVEASIDHAQPDRKPIAKPDLRRMLIPIGPIAVFGASNFPFAYSVAGGDTASAFAAGCPVVVKAHPAHPGTSELVARAIIEAARETGMPNGVFSMVHCDNEMARELVRHWRLKGVGFTGSVGAGLALQSAAAERDEPIPVFAEMGSVNPVFLLSGALEERAESIAEGYVASLTLGVGQFCTNPGIVLGIASPGWDRFVQACIQGVNAASAGVMLTESIGSGYCDEIASRRKLSGVHLAAGSVAIGSPVLLRTKVSDVSPHSGVWDEVFGPCGLLAECVDEHEMESAANELAGQLTATVHSSTSDDPSALLSILQGKVGRIVFNGFPTGVEVCTSMVHGGPFPATTDSRFTAVGPRSIERWARPVCFQTCPDTLLPDELKEANPKRIWRTVDGSLVEPRVR